MGTRSSLSVPGASLREASATYGVDIARRAGIRSDPAWLGGRAA
ncbi:hypothetical protein GCM10009836_20240 [Pseudonocardia ailaonensis]|uniref:Uncharacterized protein n=1 Tax=Pseudonocardia ailaonensis TaxID=367279 RepID=A0ABN2MXZ4_9PSEU